MKTMSRKGGLGKLVVGLGIGAGIGMLLAPKSGEELRKDLKKLIIEIILLQNFNKTL